jgi:hypothetical protein
MKAYKLENFSFNSPYPKLNLFIKLIWEDLINIRQFIVILLCLLFLPLSSLLSTYFLNSDKNPFIEHISLFNFGNIGILTFFSYSLIFPCIFSILISSFILKEVSQKTISELGCDKISYKTVYLLKTIAIITYGTIINSLSLFIFCLISYFLRLFYGVFSFFLLQFIYSIIILIFFDSFAFFTSSLINIPQKVRTIIIEFTIFIFLILTFIKPIIIYSSEGYGLNIYENFFLILDLNYHFANLYMFLMQTTFNPSNSSLNFFLMLLIGKYSPFLYKNEISAWYLDNQSYISPLFSILLIISLILIMKIIAFIYFKKTDNNAFILKK